MWPTLEHSNFVRYSAATNLLATWLLITYIWSMAQYPINQSINQSLSDQTQNTRDKQKTQLSQRSRATLHVVGSFAKSLEVTEDHWKWHHSMDRIGVPIGVPQNITMALSLSFPRYSEILVVNHDFFHTPSAFDAPLVGPQQSITITFDMEQEAQLSQRDRVTLRVIEYFVTQGHSRSFEVTLLRVCKSLLVFQ